MLRRLTLPLASAAAIAAVAAGAWTMTTTDSAAVDELDRAEIESIVREYILANPGLIVEALEAFQLEEEMMAVERQQEALMANMPTILDGGSPSVGPADADVTLVEFFDYNCGFCRRMVGPINDLIDEDEKLRVVFKEIPILGPTSIIAARASLAAEPQGLYREYHTAMMSYSGTLTEEAIFEIAAEVGLDVDALQAEMESERVANEISANLRLAQEVGIRGTPAFVIGEELIPGAVGYDVLRDAIDDQREG